ncbi:MAG: FAD-dependent oxidoreductase [Actinobacteria bacterium]|nr:FAD-dependent oxidoreductase [Actinomycetota bacterium]
MSTILVIGGNAAGASAATKARRTDEDAEIIMLEKGSYVSYANCGIPYSLGGVVHGIEPLLVTSKQRFEARFKIDVRVLHEALSIDRARKVVTIRDIAKNQVYEKGYDKLVIAVGSTPLKPRIPGLDLVNVFTLTTIEDLEAISDYILRNIVNRVTVVGAGYIGIEAIEAFHKLKKRITLIEMKKQILPLIDPEIAVKPWEHLIANGVDVLLGRSVVSVEGNGRADLIRLDDGNLIETDLVLLAIGVKPDLRLVEGTGIEVNKGVIVDEYMRTSDPDVFACGDVAESMYYPTGERMLIPLGGPANKQGRVAGANAAGASMKYRGALRSAIMRVIDMTVAHTGLTEREARERELPYEAVYLNSPSHASYYPGAKPIVTKILFDKNDGRLIGAQVVGYDGVDKRTDVFATAIYAGLSVFDLENLDLCYAPQYSSAKDAEVIIGFIASNIVRGEVNNITPAALLERISRNEDLQIIDVRTEKEYKNGYIGNAINTPIDSLRYNLDKVKRDKPTVVYCSEGYRSYHAYKILKHYGVGDIANLTGGYSVFELVRKSTAD